MSRDPANAEAVGFKRAGDPNVGEFSDAVVLKKFGSFTIECRSSLSEINSSRGFRQRRASKFSRRQQMMCCNAGLYPDESIARAPMMATLP
jgi:hypothetical protein